MEQSTSAIPFIRQVADQNKLTIDETLLEGCLELSQTGRNSDGKRGVDIELHTDGTVKASSIKAYNLLLFSQNRFRLSLLKLLPAAAGIIVIGSAVLTTTLALLGFLQIFLEKVEKEFIEQDAKVLLAIYRLGKMCHISTIAPEYKRLFNTNISEDAIRDSIHLLAQYRTVRLYDNGDVEIKESVQLSRQ